MQRGKKKEKKKVSASELWLLTIIIFFLSAMIFSVQMAMAGEAKAADENKSMFSSLSDDKPSFQGLDAVAKESKNTDASLPGSGLSGGKDLDANLAQMMAANSSKPMSAEEKATIEMLMKLKAQVEGIKAQHDKQLKELMDEDSEKH